MVKYKVVVKFYGRPDLIDLLTGKEVKVVVENPELTRIVAFSSPEAERVDLIAIYEFVPINEKRENKGD